MQFSLENVRCFVGRHRFNIRPLTFVVGENSSGKTTLLACLQAFVDEFSYERNGDRFNTEPYHLGSFLDIISKSKSDSQRIETFRLALHPEKSKCEIELVYSLSPKKELSLIESIFRVPEGEICFCVGKEIDLANDGGNNIPVRIEKIETLSSNGKEKFTVTLNLKTDFSFNVSIMEFIFDQITRLGASISTLATHAERDANKIKKFKKFVNESGPHLSFFKGKMPPFFSLSPLRAEPKRTYEPVTLKFDPSGSDIPRYLWHLSNQSPSEWNEFQRLLNAFGKESEMFENIEVVKKGDALNDPFQIQLKVHGAKSNLIDVGYGVSQVLPLLVHALRLMQRKRYGLLIQQPEVHLHPRAQAALSSLLVRSAQGGERIFVVENHSDYMLDRACIEIRRGSIKPEDVGVIYLEPTLEGVKSCNIAFDKDGELQGVPKGYRKFFHKETRDFLGLEIEE